MSSKKILPSPHSQVHRDNDMPEKHLSQSSSKCKATREQSASIDFTKWPLSKVTNCPNNILAATAGGLIIRKHLPKTLTSALRLFPCPRATAKTAEQHMLAEGAFPSAHIYHPLEQHKATKILCCHSCSP